MALCPACGSNQTFPHKKYFIPYEALNRNFSLMVCGVCGLVFTDPQPDPEQLDRIYGDDSYYAYQPFLIPPLPDISTPMGRIKQWAKRAVIDHYYGYGRAAGKSRDDPGLKIVGRLLRNLPREDMIAMRRIVPFGAGGRHLDIGSGSGAYVWWMQKHGWQSEGIELNDKAVINAKEAGLTIKKTPLLESGYPSEYFDLVTAWGVLEHLPRIKDCFEEISRIIKPNGGFSGFVPNIASWDAFLFKENWQGLEIPSHLYHFTPVTLKKMLMDAGLRVNRIEYLPGLDSWKATLDRIGIKYGAKRNILEMAGRLMYQVSNRVGRGAMFRFDSVKL
jgi:SAM-dependent methyltransferase